MNLVIALLYISFIGHFLILKEFFFCFIGFMILKSVLLDSRRRFDFGIFALNIISIIQLLLV
jgi:hypothetical protein